MPCIFENEVDGIGAPNWNLVNNILFCKKNNRKFAGLKLYYYLCTKYEIWFMHILNKLTQEALFRKIGLTYEQMQKMDAEEIDAFIEKRIGSKLKYGFSLKNIINRGSVYLFSKRLRSLSEVDKQLAKI